MTGPRYLLDTHILSDLNQASDRGSAVGCDERRESQHPPLVMIKLYSGRSLD
jgi:hypothetical protein